MINANSSLGQQLGVQTMKCFAIAFITLTMGSLALTPARSQALAQNKTGLGGCGIN